MVDTNNIAISYSITKNYGKIQEYWERKKIDKNAEFDYSTPLGGEIRIGKRVVEHPQPYGFRIIEWPDHYAIVSASTNTVTIQDGHNSLLIHNEAFNDLHDVEITSNGTYLVLSSGLDAIIEVDSEGNTLWSYYLALQSSLPNSGKHKSRLKSAFSLNEFGIYVPNTNMNDVTIKTAHRFAHPNSILIPKTHYNDNEPDRYIFLTLYHQGMLVMVDRALNTTSVLLEGLNKPHGIREHTNFASLVNTKAGEIYILDKTDLFKKHVATVLHVVNIEESSWIQDATMDQSDHIYMLDATNSTMNVYTLEGECQYFPIE